jgi:Ca2+-transporting ATPase
MGFFTSVQASISDVKLQFHDIIDSSLMMIPIMKEYDYMNYQETPVQELGPQNQDFQHPWSKSPDEVLREVNVSSEQGLSGTEVEARRNKYGENKLQEQKGKSAWAILIDQIKNFIFLLLIVAAGLAFMFGDLAEGIAILIVIIVTVLIGFFTELRAVRSIESLRQLSQVPAKVRRDGQVQEISAEELVPGDIVLLEEGDVIPADIRLLEASELNVNESALTGESEPVMKEIEALEGDTPLAERLNMVYKGTLVNGGSGAGVVVYTGMNTELGRISSMTQEAEQEQTPLDKRLTSLGHKLIWVTLLVAALVLISGLIQGMELTLLIKTAIALAVAAIPEGLPIVATLALARGMWRMSKRNALMNRLSAVETLGATNIICTDKTGTLTENRMSLERIAVADHARNQIEEIVLEDDGQNLNFIYKEQTLSPEDHEILRHALNIIVLCTNAHLVPKDKQNDEEVTSVGDPLEIALLEVGRRAGIEKDDLLQQMPEVKEDSFDRETKMMGTYHQTEQGIYVVVKGAPEHVLHSCTKVLTMEGEQDFSEEQRRQWIEYNDHLAERGLRVLAIAMKIVDSADVEAYENLSLVGMLGLLDPPRKGVDQAVQELHDAGIRVVMVTGDQSKTARNIGTALNLVEGENTDVVHGSEFKHPDQMNEQERERILNSNLFSRVTPEQKLNLVSMYQKEGYVVAMTGDGVNDAPALKKADIGIAMGLRGTQVAREAAAMILMDDSFHSIVAAVEQGRVIFRNIRKFIIFMLSGNIGEILIVAVAMLAATPLPLLPLQILFLNILYDVFPALALGVGKGDASVMNFPPRDPKESIITKRHWGIISAYGVLIAVFVLGAFFLALYQMDLEDEQAVTISFLTLAFSRQWHVFNMRDWGSSFIRNDITRNKFVWGAIGLCLVLLLLAIFVPFLSSALGIVPLGTTPWFLILGMSLAPTVIIQILKSLIRPKQREF